MQGIPNNPKPKITNIWSKIKKILKSKQLNYQAKWKYKEQIGFRLIDDNKLWIKELISWWEIYNKYKIKMPLFYKHSKALLPLFKEIIVIVDKIGNKFKISEQLFNEVWSDFLYEKTNNFAFKEIIHILSYDLVFNESKFEVLCFQEFSMVIDEEINYLNINYMKNALEQENKFYENQVNYLRDLWDKMTDMCDTKEFLDRNVVENLKVYLDKYYEEIVANWAVYYEKNKYLYEL